MISSRSAFSSGGPASPRTQDREMMQEQVGLFRLHQLLQIDGHEGLLQQDVAGGVS
jgi:hypothetical protein